MIRSRGTDDRLLRLAPLALAAGLLVLSGCATLREYAALRNVEWSFEGVRDVQLAGIPISTSLGSYSDLGLGRVTRLVESVASGELPLELTALAWAANPASNSATARLTELGWTLFIDDQRTVGGAVGGTRLIPPGETAVVPVAVRLNLMEFFEGGAQEAFELALAVAGHGSRTSELKLELVPRIETSLGPMTYPAPIVVRREVGGG